MIGTQSVLALIPARGGSKGLPDKNLRQLAGRSLLAWTIAAAKGADLVDRVVLSSDADEIMAEARRHDCEVPFRRPAELAADDTPGMDPVLHALHELKLADDTVVVLLQPTSPLRTAADIDAALRFFATGRAPAVVSVAELTKPLEWTYYRSADGAMTPVLSAADQVARRQDARPAYFINGALYLAEAGWLQSAGTYLTPDTAAYVMPAERSLDIDSLLDLQLAEMMLASRQAG